MEWKLRDRITLSLVSLHDGLSLCSVQDQDVLLVSIQCRLVKLLVPVTKPYLVSQLLVAILEFQSIRGGRTMTSAITRRFNSVALATHTS